MQVVALGQRRRQVLGARPGSHQHAHVAVGEDVRDLLGLQYRVDGDENAARGGRAEHCLHRLDLLGQEYGDPFLAGQTALEQG